MYEVLDKGSPNRAVCACVLFCPTAKAKKEGDEAPKFVPFAGGGARLDGKKTPTKGTEEGKEGKESDGAQRQCEHEPRKIDTMNQQQS